MESLIHKEPLVTWLLRGSRAGASMVDCAGMVGVSADTVSGWLRRGKAAVDKSQTIQENVPEDDFAYAKFVR